MTDLRLVSGHGQTRFPWRRETRRMKPFRRSAAATAAALAISGAAALTGIGAPAAQALTVSATHGHVTVELSPSETKIAAAAAWASAMCTFDVLPHTAPYVTISLGDCGKALHECSRAAGQRSHAVAVITFNPGRSSCTTR
jgi:hypothetical protein